MHKKFRHKVIYVLFRPFFKVFLRVRFGYRFTPFDETTLKGPYLILGNHTQNLDPIFLALSFKKPIYFVASTMVFNLPVISWFLKYLVNPIPIDKFRSDVKSAKRILKVLKEGSHVSLFPEGNTSFSGQQSPIDVAIAKLAKVAGVPVVIYNLKGGYLTRPRWALYKRKGPMHGAVTTVLTPEEIKSMDVETLHLAIIKLLKVNDFETMKQHRYPGPKKAEGLESAYYYCPGCHAFETLYSHHDHVFCQACDFSVEANDFGGFEKNYSGFYYSSSIDWFNAQKEALSVKIHQSIKTAPLFNDEDWTLYRIIPLKPKQKLMTVSVVLSSTQLQLLGENSQLTLAVEALQSAVQMRNNLILHDKVSDITYYLVPPAKGNSLKYVDAIELSQKEHSHV